MFPMSLVSSSEKIRATAITGGKLVDPKITPHFGQKG